MSIFIKGADMPIGCFSATARRCPCYDIEFHWCAARDLQLPRYIKADTRPEWCPLVEVPTPHGRLIDQEAMMQTDPLGYINYCHSEERIASILHQVLAEDAEIPFVIEAED